MHTPVPALRSTSGPALPTTIGRMFVVVLMTVAISGAGCEQTQKASPGGIESHLTNPMADMTDMSGRRIAQAQPTRSTRVGGLTATLPRADTSACGHLAPTKTEPSSATADGAVTSDGSSDRTQRITSDDLPYAGPAPARLPRGAASAVDEDGASATREPFPRSDFQRRQEAQLAAALPPRQLSSETPGAASVDLEGDAAAPTPSDSNSAPSRATIDAPRSPASEGGTSGEPNQARPWGIVLATFSGDDSRSVADAVAAQYRDRYPQLPDIHVRSKPSGSVVLAGRFVKPGDADAQALLTTVKAMESDGKKLFPKAMFTMMSGVVDGERIAPHDIRQLRLQYPETDPLYSLQVAVWSDLESGTLDPAQIRRSAEAACAELRAQGQLAFFSHSDQTRTSVVTVGVFGADAYDPRSTLFSDEVMALLKIFPKHLVNGEELLVSIDPRDPGKLVPQAPRLVEVPR